jgi:hypothetical protein
MISIYDYFKSLEEPEWKRPFIDLIVPGKIITVRQSSINIFNECRRKYFYEYIAGEDEIALQAKPYHIRMLIGSICHAIIADNSQSAIKDGDYHGLMTLIDSLRMKQQYDMQGQTTESLARKFFDGSIFWGYSLYQVAKIARGILFMQGWKFIETEYSMSQSIVSKSKQGSIEISGTLDALCVAGDDTIVVDFKFGGLSNRLINQSTQCKADSYSPLEITYSTQHNMYDFLISKNPALCKYKPTHYVYVVPVSVIPAQSGPNKGKWRGELIHKADALSENQLSDYFYNNLLEVVREISRCTRENIWTRSHPSIYGRITCPSCRWKSQCLGVSETSNEYVMDDPGYL